MFCGSVAKNPPANAGDTRDIRSILGSGRSPGGGNGNPLQYSCLGNPRDRGNWQVIVHRVGKPDTTEPTCMHRTRFMCVWEECVFCCCYGVLYRCLSGLIGIHGKVSCNTWGAIKFFFFFRNSCIIFVFSPAIYEVYSFSTFLSTLTILHNFYFSFWDGCEVVLICIFAFQVFYFCVDFLPSCYINIYYWKWYF